MLLGRAVATTAQRSCRREALQAAEVERQARPQGNHGTEKPNWGSAGTRGWASLLLLLPLGVDGSGWNHEWIPASWRVAEPGAGCGFMAR